MVTQSSRTVPLPEVLDLTAAAPLANLLLTLRGTALELDASGVQRIGGLCLQVLLSAAKTWRADGVPLSITKTSAEFVAGLIQMGIEKGILMEGGKLQ